MPLKHEKPNRALLRELNAVARVARALDGALRRTNFLPPKFPDDELQFWIDKLQALPDGTAEGCREPLCYAQERLSAVIRDHIIIDDDAIEETAGTDADDLPFPARGEPIEQAITNLIGAISVANSEYERQADESHEEVERDRPLVPTAAESAALDQLGNRAGDLEVEAETLEAELDNSAYVHDTEITDRLKRQTRDAETTLAVTRHAVQQRPIRPSLMSRLSRAMGAIAEAGVATWQLARLGVDLTAAGVRHFGNYGSEMAMLPFKHFGAFADDVEAKVEAFRQARARGRKTRAPFSIFKEIDALWCPEMVMLPAGSFLMGSPDDEEGRLATEGPQHEVEISRPFALGRFAVTFEEFDHFCDEAGREKPSDSDWGRSRRPVINVSHLDATAYCAWLSEVTGKLYRLPSEAEWEYACRAGTTAPFSFGDTITTDQVNFDGNHPYADSPKGNFRQQTVPVGDLPPNPWGLFEMHGNIWEWCADDLRTYRPGRERDPKGPDLSDPERVVRGGSWSVDARLARAAYRYRIDPGDRHDFLGFRCAGVQES